MVKVIGVFRAGAPDDQVHCSRQDPERFPGWNHRSATQGPAAQASEAGMAPSTSGGEEMDQKHRRHLGPARGLEHTP